MPNVNNPFGLRPLARTLSGGAPTIQQIEKAAGYATPIYIFDAVNQVADGSIEVSATPGTTLYSGVNLTYGKASTLTQHLVITSPDAVFVAQGNSSGSLDRVDRGLNANLHLFSGNPNTLISGHQIQSSSKATAATLDVKLLDLLDVPDNEYGTFARFMIVFNKHRMNPGVAGV